MTIHRLLASWRANPDIASNIVVWQERAPRAADLRPLPADLPPLLTEALHARGIPSLYSHQAEAWQRIRNGENIILSTEAASGKTLAYNLPVLATLLEDPLARVLYLFPTKALTQDQFTTLTSLQSQIEKSASEIGKAIHPLPPAVYDGDTPPAARAAAREKARLLLTNPDMLHMGILPQHARWEPFFRHLRFVVIDEMHTYRGVFGSHVANVLRRLKRIARFYGANPQFILASATIGNPQELAERLIEAPVSLIDRDGSTRGPRFFLIYNPPLIDSGLGLRKSPLLESVRLTRDLLKANAQTVVFARSRRSVEVLLKILREEAEKAALTGSANKTIRGYRSGYLPSQRREIEQGLRAGTIRAVVATNALELGIDIGGLEAAILVGYPGTIASTRQQTARAGRGQDAAVAILVVSSEPLDQFLARHPSYLLEASPERALINPNHLLILLYHLRCALYELPFSKEERFGNQSVEEYLEVLVSAGEASRLHNRFFWASASRPANEISLRSASAERFLLQVAEHPLDTSGNASIIGMVDGESALWMVHPGAVYLHEAQSYQVFDLNLEQKVAYLRPFDGDYYTEPILETQIQILNRQAEAEVPGGYKGWGEISVLSRVTGFRKLRWYSRENLGEESLDLPTTELRTCGYWIALAEETVSALRSIGAWSNEPNDYGPDWPRLRDLARARDGFRCIVCGAPETERQHDVHHKIPFRAFLRLGLTNAIQQANQLDNLITLCASCHRKVEQSVRIRSGLAGLGYVLVNLAPLFLMCDRNDLGLHLDPASALNSGLPIVVLYDQIPAGLGFSQQLFEVHSELVSRALELVAGCSCEDGCPSCVGPGGEQGSGGKEETLALLRALTGNNPANPC